MPVFSHRVNLALPAAMAPLAAWLLDLWTPADIAALYFLGVFICYFRDFRDRMTSTAFETRKRYEE